MPAANKTEVMSYFLATPSPPPSSSRDEDSESDSNHRRRNGAWLSPTSCNCLSLFFGGLGLVVLFLISIAIPLTVILTRSVAEISSTSTPTGSTITATTATIATTTISTMSTTSTASTSSTSSTTSSTSVTIMATSHITTTTAITSSTTTVTTTTVMTCVGGNSSSSGALATQSGANPSFWTQYNYSYVALTTSPVLAFAFTTDLNNNYFLDTVSVTRVSAPSTELLQNPSFENSTTMLIGWVVWCDGTCSAGAGAGAQATWGTNCYLSTGNCFLADCPDTGSGAIVFLGQSFSAVVGATYRISFRLRIAYGGGGLSLTKFTASIN